ncbi:hypothetical protein [Ralstonia phage BHDT_So9]|uniref:Uncharacterized protein n=1 Tax=Ralstonia phage BHDT_So9 TaxID=2972464 RepID=A0A9E7U659_9CAUD|nr:hypothetical protein [Ralstonia phage BHDT_So9]UWI83539.1 hypothetical protein [Ralstonia phage DLDT_So2]UZT26927.1 hypothetical protein [Ralstonia phage BHDTSo81]WEM03455.1 hypothetical protein [Ralstonia phage BHDT8]
MCITTEQAIARQADYSNAASALAQVLAQHPQIVSGLDKLGEGFLGDVRVEFYGEVHYLGRGFGGGVSVDLEEIALAGTTVSMSTLVGAARWEKIEAELQASIESAQ